MHKYQFLFFNGTLISLFFKAILTEIGIGSNEGLMLSGAMILVDFILFGLLIILLF